jgi:lipoprotein Spr
MTQSGSAIAAAGRALCGVCFRPQGRDKAIGLDCVGVVGAALAEAGYSVRVSSDYAQRGGNAAGMAAMMDRSGLHRIALATAEAGDVLLLETGAAQFHLALLTADGFVHADAVLRRVVEVPGRPRWPAIGAWRAVAGES